jgi:hypothetical protein
VGEPRSSQGSRPLLTFAVVAFAIGAENRHAQWIHYQLMEAACEALLHVPFTSGNWAPGAGHGACDAVHARGPGAADPSATTPSQRASPAARRPPPAGGPCAGTPSARLAGSRGQGSGGLTSRSCAGSFATMRRTPPSSSSTQAPLAGTGSLRPTVGGRADAGLRCPDRHHLAGRPQLRYPRELSVA